MKAGEKLAVRVRGVRQPDGRAHSSGAVAGFWAPGRDPEHDPGDRDPDYRAVLSFDPVTREYGRDVATAGWRPGTWTVQGAVLDAGGEPEGWGWYQVPLDPLPPIAGKKELLMSPSFTFGLIRSGAGTPDPAG